MELSRKECGVYMTTVTIIGATGSLGRITSQVLLEETDANLVLLSRRADSLKDHPRVKKMAASVYDQKALEEAVEETDLVFVALSGDLPSMVKEIIKAMKAKGRKRIVFISSYGIYGELPGQNGRVDPILEPYRQAADILEGTDLEFTILRPGWFDNAQTRARQLIPKGEVIQGHSISRLALADLVKEMSLDTSQYVRGNLGIIRE